MKPFKPARVQRVRHVCVSSRGFASMLLAAALVCVPLAGRAQITTRTETFPSASSDEFDPVGNPTANGAGGDYSNFGWRNSTNAGGALGEGGGAFARRGYPGNWYADTNLGGIIGRSNSLVMSGKFKIDGNQLNASGFTFDGFHLLGYFGGNHTSGNSPFLGIRWQEPTGGSTGPFRCRLWARNANGSVSELSSIITVPQGSLYTFNLTFSASPDGSGVFSGTIQGQAISVNVSASADAFHSFGMGTSYFDDGPTGVALFYYDDLTYSVKGAIGVPVITANPTNLTVCSGNLARFYVTASGTNLAYQWQASGNGGVSFTNISGAATTSYTNLTTPVTDNGKQYRVVVTNSSGAVTSSTALLTVNTAPTISAGPTNQTVYSGNPAAFYVTAGGGGLNYQWQASGNGGATFTNISGANSSSYTTPATVTADNAKQFRVIVSSGCGSLTSAPPAALTVLSSNPAPFINTWVLLGPFDNQSNSGFATAWIDETTVAPRVGTVSGGLEWVYFDDRLFSRNMDDYVDLYSYYTTRLKQNPEWKVTYLHTYVYSPVAQSARLRVGSNDGFKSWVNGVLVGSFSGKRGALKDESNLNISLLAGWNRLLLKVANQQKIYGCYARVCDANGNAIYGLMYSVGGTGGPLEIVTQAMPATRELPKGFVGWSYISLKTAGTHVNSAAASPFYLQAQGGTPPYTWSLVAGSFLPPGLTLASDGSIQGRPTGTARTNFSVRVTDGLGSQTSRQFSLAIDPPPTQNYLQGNFGSILHDPGYTVINGMVVPDPRETPAQTVNKMKREGYNFVIPRAAGGPIPKWPAPYHAGEPDWITPFYDATLVEGVHFGIYYSAYNGYETTLGAADPIDHITADIEDAILRWKPEVYWFDELGYNGSDFVPASQILTNRQYDALHSLIKSYTPGAVVMMNDGFGPERDARGDIDLREFEGSHSSWLHWPEAPTDNDDKTMPIESWRFPSASSWPGFTTSEVIRQMVALVGNGHIANLDRTLDVAGQEQLHAGIETWMSPAGLPPRAPSFTQTKPSPLNNYDWGYSRMSLNGDKIYLHIMNHPNHKIGWTNVPGNRLLTVSPITKSVSGVRDLNNNVSRSFTKIGSSLTINLVGVPEDPIDSIIEITLPADPPAPADPDPDPIFYPFPPSTTPVTLTNVVVGSNLKLTWPVDHIGWRLEVQTNTLSVGLSTNWHTWPGSIMSNTVSIPLHPANPSVLFRLSYP